MMEYKKLILDGHPDIYYFIKGLIWRDMTKPMVKDSMALYFGMRVWSCII